jgi:hypothetical protein
MSIPKAGSRASASAYTSWKLPTPWGLAHGAPVGRVNACRPRDSAANSDPAIDMRAIFARRGFELL